MADWVNCTSWRVIKRSLVLGRELSEDAQMMRQLGRFSLVLMVAVGASRLSAAYEKIRFYEFGENDLGAAVGGAILTTADSQSSPTYEGKFTDGPNWDPPGLPTGEEFVNLSALGDAAAPMYTPGRLTGLSAFFAGDDYLEGATYDPRANSKGEWTAIDPIDYSFTTVSQAWVRPSASGKGQRQVLWQVGPENGGVAITADGKWEIVHPNRVLDIPVKFDRWTHITMRRGENTAILYIDGEVAGDSPGTWGGLGAFTVGAGLGGADGFVGQLDDLNISAYRGPSALFDPTQDIDFFTDLKLSGVRGDVNQDSKVDQGDYVIWSSNSGFDNQFGFGDPSTLLLGDVDGNGRINFFDFQIISDEAAAGGVALQVIPEPASAGWLAVTLGLAARRVRRCYG